MTEYKIIGIDLAKTKLHLAALDHSNAVVFKKAIFKNEFIQNLPSLFPTPQTFGFEACGGANHMGQVLEKMGHKVIALKPKDVKPYAKSRQKNDINDAIGICKAALDPDLKKVRLKTPAQQRVSFLHKARANVIQRRIQLTNSLLASLHEFGYTVLGGKTQFAKTCVFHVEKAFEEKRICKTCLEEMLVQWEEITHGLKREKALEAKITEQNKSCSRAQLLLNIPGIGPLNASILSNKSVESYECSKDFAASLGLVPKQHSTGGEIHLGGITKQGDRYARTLLIQGARSIVMRLNKPNAPQDDPLFSLAQRLKKRGKKFNVISVAVANKLARIVHAILTKNQGYRGRLIEGSLI